ncbi:MAG TPA: NADH:flavin oxidoreductase/NADH oxidase [Hyphomicrobiaceae bacterium]|nr:NADH:flavin oxidoreductase/NADH oxidase [Hyphomicrobiaceae bacterium]
MSNSALFSPARLNGLDLPNRIVVSPMCQYSAEDGSASDWHMMHLGMLSNSGAGLLIIEATGVEPAGRITPGCLGLYSDENEQALKRVVDACRKYGSAKIGIQLGHAGRKASTNPPWQGTPPGGPLKEGAWQTKAPSAIPFNEGWHVPKALTSQEIEELIEAFAAAARRADRIGLDLIELHGAHGYLINEFLSPLTNKREDEWGGSLENRMRFPLEVFKAVRAVWPQPKPLGIRISAVEWVDGGWTIEDSIELAKRLKDLGCDYIDVSSGGNNPNARIPIGPGYQVPFAEQIKKAVGIPVMTVGMITEAQQAESIIAEGKADFVAIARAFLDNPHWAWHAAYKLGAEPMLPNQYLRVGPRVWPPAKQYAASA